jgi:hypothetical protein
MSVRSDLLASKLKRSSDLLRYRRINWRVETAHMIRRELSEFIRETRDSKVVFDFSLREFDTPNEGIFQLEPSPNPIGVVNRRMNPLLQDESANDVLVIERGGSLVASLSFNGYVHFIAHPRFSDRTTPSTKEIFLTGPIEPTKVTPHLIQRVLDKYLLVLRSTSVFGMEDTLSYRERMVLLWIYFIDIRKKNQLIRSVFAMSNEWTKVLAAGLVAYVVGYLTAGKS